jgi:hypothetical protein
MASLFRVRVAVSAGAGRRPAGLLHQDETGPLQVLYQALRGDPRHGVVGMPNPLAAVEPQRVGEALFDLQGAGRAQGRLLIVAHWVLAGA